MRTIIAAAVVLAVLGGAHASDDYDAGRRAAALMAGVNACKIEMAPTARQALYDDMLRAFKTPSQINYNIDIETKAISKMPSPDRDAMCSALASRIRSLK